MQLIEAFVRNPVKISVGVLLVALFGFIALVRMPMQLTPEVEIPKISISTRWPGASPGEVEREIVQEQEEQLQSVEGVTKMTSSCGDSVGEIVLEFPVGYDLDEALLKVNARLQQVSEYPEDANEPVISTSDTRANAVAYFVLRPHVGTADEIAAVQTAHPELAELLEPVRRARNTGLRGQRLRTLVTEHPEIKPHIASLMPDENLHVPDLQIFAEDFIESRFERIPGVSNANVWGGREEEMQVIVDPERLAARRLTIMDVRNALRQQNQDVSAGDISEGKRRYVVRTLGRFVTPEQVGDVIVGQGETDSPIYLRDVADVELGFKKPTSVVRNFGSACLSINCIRETGANVLDVMEALRETTADLNRGLLHDRGLELVQTYDETDYIYSAINLVIWNIVIGAILTVGVLLLFLRSGRATLVIALAIPTSIIGTFLLLALMGRTLNVISLAGLSFAVGMLVDNAVVVLENCYRHAQTGERPFVAVVRGAKEVWGAVVASTLTTLAVFLPVLFIQEEVGQLFRDIALAISSAVGLSLIVSITVIPTAAARLLRTDRGESVTRAMPANRSWLSRFLRPLDRGSNLFVDGVVNLNRFLQQNLLRRLVTVVLLVGVSVLLSYLLLPPVEYLPPGNRNLVMATMLPPPGYSIERSLAAGADLETAIRPYWDLDLDDPASKTLPYPVIQDYFYVARPAQVFLGMRAADERRARELVRLLESVTADVPGSITRASQRSLFSRELGVGRTIDIEITGPDLEGLVNVGKQIFRQVPEVVRLTERVSPKELQPGDRIVWRDEESQLVERVTDAARAFPVPSLDLNSPEIHVIRKTKRATDMGVSTEELGYTVNALIDGAYASDYYEGGKKIDLSILGGRKFSERTQDLGSLAVATPTGALTRLDGLATLEFAGGPEQIRRRERQRAITISVTPPDEMPLETAITLINEQIIRPGFESGTIPAQYQINLAGTADKLAATWKALRWNILLALLVTYLLMAALFESWLHPFVIILSVPLGAIGGLVGLYLVNLYLRFLPYTTVQQLDVITMLGFVILIGTVVNNPILIVHQSLNHMQEEGMSADLAILTSVRSRIRPIFMTTITTILGLFPLVLFPGAGSELYRGLGAVVLGGLLVSTIFTLVLVPVLFSLSLETKTRFLRRLGGGRSESHQISDVLEEEPDAVMVQ
ncbi:MAG: efflux RND transporter permease subunit [Pirellulaceae bacterium]